MATKKIVPRANNEGGIGTAAKTWGDSWLYNLTVTDLDTSTSASLVVEDSGLLGKRSALTLLPNLTTFDEGNSLTATTVSYDFVGAGVTATASGNAITVTIPGTSGVLDTEDSSCFVGLWEDATGNLAPKTDESLLYDASAEILNIIGTLKMGSSANANLHKIHRETTAGAANGGALSILAGDTTGGTNHAGGYLHLYPGKGTGSGGGVASGVSIFSSYQGSSGSTAQTYVKNTLFYSLGLTMGQRQYNPADSNDWCETVVGANGATTISTVDNAGATAHMVYNIDGNITHNAAGENHYWTGGGAAEMNLDTSGLTINNISTDAALTSFLVETSGLVKKRPLSGIPAALTTVSDTDDTTCFVGLWPDASGNLAAHTDEVFKYNAHSNVLFVPTIYANTNTTSAASNLQLQAESAISGGPTNADGGHVALYGSSGTGTGASGGVQIYGTRLTTSGTGSHTRGYIALFDNRTASVSEMTIWDPASVSPTDYFRVSTTAAGATTISTLDAGGAAAHLVLDSDGDTSFKKTGTTLATVESLRTEHILIACSDETTSLTAGTAKTTFRMPYAFTVKSVRASVNVEPTGAILTVDINEAGATILTTKLTIDIGDKTSVGAATAAVIGGAGPALADDAEITIDVDQIGSTAAGAGLKVTLIGYKTV